VIRVDRTFPDVQAHGQARSAQEQAHGNEKHVCHNVFQAQGDEGEDRPPHAHHLGSQVLSLQPEEAGQAYQPVAANGAEEDLVELEVDLLLFRVGDSLLSVGTVVEDATVCPVLGSQR
jgi:hypothetical protein